MASLFVSEEDQRMEEPVSELQESSTTASPKEEVEDDPIVESIPIVMAQVPDHLKQSMHVLQYMERPHARTLRDEHVRIAVKKESQYVEVRIPVDTSKFYDVERAEDWNGGQEGEGIDEQSLQGVMNHTDGGMYVGQIVADEATGSRKLVVVPVDSTVQLRHSFKYLDDLDTARTANHRGDMEHKAVTNIQILQTSAKASLLLHGQDGAKKSALGGSLRLAKKLKEEEWSHLAWEPSSSAQTVAFKELLTTSNSTVLQPATSKEEYLTSLIL